MSEKDKGRTNSNTGFQTTPPVDLRSSTEPSQYIEDDAYSIKNEVSNYLNRLDSREDLSHYPGAELSYFDYTQERRNYYTTNILESIGHMIKGMLGIGILSMHEAYMHGGTVTGIVATCVLSFIAPYNTLMLVRTAQKTYRRLRIAKMTYPDLMEAAVAKGPKFMRRCRKCFRYTVDFFLILELCSSCNVYQVMTAMTIRKIVDANVDPQPLNFRIYILLVALPLFLLCSIKRLKILARLSIAGDVFIVIFVLLALGYGIPGLPPISERKTWRDLHGLFGFTGIFIYSIDSITLALPIENNMTRPTFFPLIAWLAIPTVIIFCTLVGFFGYWKWGEKCITPIILHLPMNTFSMVMYGIFSLVLCLTFSVNFWIPFKIMWRYLKKRITKRRGCWEAIGRILLVLIITCISVAFPDIVSFIGVIGNVLLGFITFIFPPIIHFCLTFEDGKCRLIIRLFNVLSLLIGFFLIGGGIYTLFV